MVVYFMFRLSIVDNILKPRAAVPYPWGQAHKNSKQVTAKINFIFRPCDKYVTLTWMLSPIINNNEYRAQHLDFPVFFRI